MTKTRTLVERLRHSAERMWPEAMAVSNLHKPESDNDFGRASTAMREAAGEIERLTNTLLWIASMADEENEWDGVDRFRVARQKAIDATCAHEPRANK